MSAVAAADPVKSVVESEIAVADITPLAVEAEFFAVEQAVASSVETAVEVAAKIPVAVEKVSSVPVVVAVAVPVIASVAVAHAVTHPVAVAVVVPFAHASASIVVTTAKEAGAVEQVRHPIPHVAAFRSILVSRLGTELSARLGIKLGDVLGR